MNWNSIKAIMDRQFSGKYDPIWFGNDLSVEQQTFQRGKPRNYMLCAIDLLNAIGGNTIVEIGCMRQPMNHHITEFNPYCCNDGHSTVIWAASGKDVFSVDINPVAVAHAKNATKSYANVSVTCGDGVAYLKEFPQPIDLLFLDAWDGDTPNFSENHLVAFESARSKMAEKSIILIDDTDVHYGGKGRLVIPAAIRNGYSLLLIGRQTMLMRGVE